MKIIKAKIIDSIHLELTQPLSNKPGEYIQISIPDKDEEDSSWYEEAKKQLLKVYDDQDAIYDEL